MSKDAPLASDECLVRGVVRYLHGRPLSGVVVRAVNVNLRSEDRLGEARTDGRGAYAIPYSKAILQPRHKVRADVVVRVHAPRAGRRAAPGDVIAETSVRRAAQPIETIDILVEGTAADVWSEHDRLTSDVAPLLEGVALEDVDETAARPDLSYLAAQLGQPRAVVDALVGARRLSVATSLPAELFYGLLRAGLPPSLPRLLAVPPAAMRVALQRAFDEVRIPWSLQGDLERHLRALYGHTVTGSLEKSSHPTGGLGAILGLVLEDLDRQQRFLTHYLGHRGTVEAFWGKVRSDVRLGADVEALRQVVHIATLLGGDAALTARVFAQLKLQPLGTVTSWSVDTWRNLVSQAHSTGSTFPPGVPGRTSAEREEAYVGRLMSVIPIMIADGDLIARMSPRAAATLVIFFDDPATSEICSPAVHDALPSSSLRKLLAGESLTQGIRTPELLRRDLVRLQSLYKAAKSGAAVEALLTKGFRSALDIAVGNYRVKSPVPQHSGAPTWRAIHAESSRITAGALVLLGELGAALNQVRLYAVDSSTNPSALGLWESILGSTDLLACGPCQSAVSPAAYFVDALEFLRSQAGVDGGVTGFADASQALLDRRPELAHLELTCANTHTEIPHIDLVNEVLAEEIAPFTPFELSSVDAALLESAPSLPDEMADDFATSGETRLGAGAELRTIDAGRWAVRDRGVRYVLEAEEDGAVAVTSRTCQTWTPAKKSTGEHDAAPGSPLAAPQHLNAAAAAVLAGATGDLALPFDLSHATVAAHLRQIRVPRHELMEAFREAVAPPSGPIADADAAETFRRTALAIERIGFSHQEWLSMSWYGHEQDPDLYPAEVAVRWGLQEPVDYDEQATVRTILAQARLSMAELEALLECEHVNPGRLHRLDTSSQEFLVTDLDDVFLLRLHDLVRLWRRLGWNVRDVDRVVTALGRPLDQDGWMSDDFVRNLAAFLDLMELTSADVRQALEMAADLDPIDEDSEYARLFLAAESPLDTFLLRDGEPSGPATYDEWLEAEAVLRGAFRVPQRDLVLLEELAGLWNQPPAVGATVVPDKISIATLSVMKRAAALARATSLSIEDLLALRRLSSIEPLDPVDLSKVVRFIRCVNEINDAGWSVAELDGLLGPVERERGFFLDDQQVRAGLEELRVALASPLAASGPLVPPPDVSATQKNLGLTVSGVFASRAGVPVEVAESLLTHHLHDPRDGSSDVRALFTADAFLESNAALLQPTLFVAYRRIMKALGFVQKLNVDATLLRLLATNGGLVGALQLDTLPVTPAAPTASPGDPPASFDGWRSWIGFVAHVKRLQGGSRSMASALERYELAGIDGFVEQTAALQQWRPVDVEFVVQNAQVEIAGAWVGLSTAGAMANWQAWDRLFACMTLLARLGASAEKAFGWARVAPDETAAREVPAAVRTAYSPAQWTAVSQSIQDPIRQRHCDALVAYLLMQRNADGERRWADVRALSGHVLIDVEMAPAVTTSRLRQAMNTVQMFAQRCLLDLERGATDDVAGVRPTDSWKPWRSYERYRLWEAQRQIFLAPENWLEPELRDDKSPLFEALESELQQNDLADDAIEDALANYVEGLLEIADLHVLGVLHEENPAGEGSRSKVSHVVARTRGTPRIHYHRQRVGEARWGPWRRIDLDIDADQVLPVIWNRRLHLFWPIFTQAGGNENTPAQWKIQIAWSEYSRGRWSGKRVTAEHMMSDIEVPNPNGAASTSGMDAATSQLNHYFRVVVDPTSDALSVFWHSMRWVESTSDDGEVRAVHGRDGEFRFLGCGGEVMAFRYRDLVETKEGTLAGVTYFLPAPFVKDPLDGPIHYVIGNPPIHLPQRLGARISGTTLLATGAGVAFLPVCDDPWSDSEVLEETPGPKPYRYVHPATDEPGPTLRPFVFQDAAHALYIEQRAVRIPSLQWQLDPDLGAIDQTAKDFYLDYFVQEYPRPPGGKPWPVPASKNGSAGALAAAPTSAPTPPAPGPQGVGSAGLLAPGALAIAAAVGGPVATKPPAGAFAFDPGSPLTWPTQLQKWLKKTRATKVATDVDYPYNLVGPRHEYRYTFTVFQHPFACEFVRELKRAGIDGLYARELQERHGDASWFQDRYRPRTEMITGAHARLEVDFSYRGTYSLYNWELFFHVPVLIAIRLSQMQRFEEAQRWFHRVFNPQDRSSDPSPQRFWQCKPLRDVADPGHVAARLTELEQAAESDQEDAALSYQVNDILEQPSNPHAVARARLFVYQRFVIMRYVLNLVDWGDLLFRQDTTESLNAAAQRYLLALDVLGPRPIVAQEQGDTPVGTYVDPTSNGVASQLEELSQLIPMTSAALLSNQEDRAALVERSLLCFCVPPNEQMLALWTTVHDRLFKIRNSQNIDGVFRRLALFDPPIDPAILVRAAAAGLDLSQALADVNVARPHYRFEAVLGLAKELVNDVKSFGAALLAALEKRDAEGLALLRSSHEQELLGRVSEVRTKQIEESKQQLEGLRHTRRVTEARRDYYRDLKRVSGKEQAQLDKMRRAYIVGQIASSIQAGVSVAALIPTAHVQGVASGTSTGGMNFATALQGLVQLIQMGAAHLSYEGTRYSVTAGQDRRWQEWKLQERLATRELEQIDKQIAAAEVRTAIAETEFRNHETQLEHSRAADRFLREKFTNKQLYDWMVGQLSGLYFQAYQLAYDWAKRAERSYQHDLGASDPHLVEFGWDSLKKGLLAGERLERALRRLETSYRDRNVREYELRKDVSLAQLDPEALLALRHRGECMFWLPEALFDADHPGHFYRRIKSVSISIPGVIGPYAGVHARLTLMSSSFRVSEEPADYLPRVTAGDKPTLDATDPRFRPGMIGVESIVTSTGNGDGGLFELNFRDERYLPFEGAGAISHWRLEMPVDSNSFDRSTVADIVLHVAYTARDGDRGRAPGENTLADAARAALAKLPEPAAGTSDDRLVYWAGPLARARPFRLYSVRRNFPDAWLGLQAPDGSGVRTARLRLPPDGTTALGGMSPILRAVDVFLDTDAAQGAWVGLLRETPAAGAPAAPLALLLEPMAAHPDIKAPSLVRSPAPTGTDWTLHLRGSNGAAALRDVYLVLFYGQ